ncbi:hypothetical protein Ancab_040504 [Ancistrocladus abbreviatus]
MGKGRPRAVEKGGLGQLSSVEPNGSLNIPSGPVYYPTEDEFKDPLEFVYKIRPEAEPYGICKIVPPKSWKPPFSLDLNAFTFPTKTQAIHQLQARPASSDSKTFELEYSRFLEAHCGRKSKRKVVFEGEELDLCKLFNAVKRFGGYDKVVNDKKWGEVFRFVRSGRKISECAKHVLCQLYREHLYDYENCYNKLNYVRVRNCKRGTNSGTKIDRGADSDKAGRCKRGRQSENKHNQRANSEKAGSCKEVSLIEKGIDSKKARNCRRGTQSENKSDQRTDSKRARNCKRRRQWENNSNQGTKFSGSKKKRKCNNSGTDKVCLVEKEEGHDQICEQCKSGLHGEVMLLCDRCNKGWHIHCLSPPLEAIPPGNWYCFECLNSDKDSFGFVPGKCISLETFRKVADRMKKKWFGSGSCSRLQIEKKFWEIVEGSLGEVVVKYGSDLDTSVYGSGFPRVNDQRPESVEAGIWDEYCDSPWNLNNLPKLKGSMLRTVHHSIAGVMVPWLYIGMLFSAFCWHFEDHCFYSMNYHHWGEPKCWYSVPGSKASAFEEVMRNCLPDLFDAQPDLLFQLVTMLNPAVLLENSIPVYSVLQEPGNFVITFPRSYHGGFNLGLNCAEAVNFAPADWLPHGGFGAELYRLYHKTAVLSHEELLCVVAKSGCDNKVLPYLNKELVRVLSKEKLWRERLWKKGVVRTSVMSPRKHPEYVATEEDPTCIICQQYLYLSAVVCRCRRSTYVCLEHWQHLCECNPRRRRLLFRHSLAELNQLVLMKENIKFETPESRSMRRVNSFYADSASLSKKVKDKQVGLAELAEQWILSSCKIFQLPFSGEAYSKALKEAEQFVWAGQEMDPVRDMVKNMVAAKDWAESIHDTIRKVENWSCLGPNEEKVHLDHIADLLKFDPVPCNEPGRLKLKEHAEAARVLIKEIHDVLAKSPVPISELDDLYARASNFPIHVKESEELLEKISAVKVWIGNIRKCFSGDSPAIDVDTLHHLKSEMQELEVQLPESEMLQQLIDRAEVCQAQCHELLKGCITMKRLEQHIQEFESFKVNIPELELLRQYQIDATLWITRFNSVLLNIHKQEDQENAVIELKCLQNDGALLKVQVDELALVEIEMKRACCRKKAFEAHSSKMPVEFIQQVLSEAVVLQIEKEKLFVSISEVLAAALAWENRAKKILAVEASMEDFEDAIRMSEDIYIILPSFMDVMDALSAAKTWLETSKPFLEAANCAKSSSAFLTFESLKEQFALSKLLKVSLVEQVMIETVLKNCEEWRHDACSCLKDVDDILNVDIGDGMDNNVILKIEELITGVEGVTAAGLSLGFNFPEISKLQDAGSMLRWCLRALSFCSVAPSLEEVNSLTDAVNNLPFTCNCGSLFSTLIAGVTWLKTALEVLSVLDSGRGIRKFKLSDAECALMESQVIKVSFPAMLRQLEDAIEKHKVWKEEVHAFFGANADEQSWASLLQLMELGKKSAFSCPELDMVHSEVESVVKWRLWCQEVVGSRDEDLTSLIGFLLKIQQSLHRSLYIYEKSKGWKVRYFCTGCSANSDDQEFITCSSCKDCYHLRCLVPVLPDTNDAKEYVCPYCLLVESGSICRSGDSPLRYAGKRPELKMLVDLLSDAKKFHVWIEERDVLQEIVDQALSCRACLTEIMDCALAYVNEDVTSISRQLTIALKALDVAGVCDPLASHKFDIALARNSWRVRAVKLLEDSQKPVIQQLQRHLKEALAINIPAEDYFQQKLLEVKQTGLRWAEIAKKVAADNGELELEQVFELISEGENLPVRFEKELKLLQVRSVLYCICRKPYDQRAMIACDQCDEWYHFDCVDVVSPPPKVYICPACEPLPEGNTSFSESIKQDRSAAKDGMPQTPSPRYAESRGQPKSTKLSLKKNRMAAADEGNNLWSNNGVDRLLWRNRKPFRRTAKKRAELDRLSPFFHS